MKFALMIYQPASFDATSYPQAEQEAMWDAYRAINDTPGVTPGLPLGVPAKARTVRAVGGEVQVTEGPYVDEAGAVGGYLVFDAPSEAEALALAARVPAARIGGAVEVRPVEVYW